MRTFTLTITDTIHLRTVTAGQGEVVDAIRGWFSEAPREVVDQLDQLDGILSSGHGGESLEELEVALGIHVEIA